MIRSLRYYKLLIFCLLCFYGCKVKDLAVSDIDAVSFKFKEVPLVSTQVLEGNVLALMVPYGTDLKNLTPTFNISGGGTSVPKADVVQDFSGPVYYTTINPSGGKKIFTVKISQAAQPQPEVSGLVVDSVYAGNKFTVIGKNFGKYGLDIKAQLTSETGGTTQVLTSQLIDSTKIGIASPDTLSPGKYFVKITVKSLSASSTQKIKVMYPIAEISQIPFVNILQGTDLQIVGKYILPKKYTYQVRLKNSSGNYTLDLNDKSENNQAITTLTNEIKEGKYSISIINKSTVTESVVFKNTVTVYDNTKPFITAIVTPKDSIGAGKSLILKVLNFDKYPIRFYQVTLNSAAKSYIINGIYDKASQKLMIGLPNNIINGQYTINCHLSSDSYKYNFSVDDTIYIK